MIGLLVCSCVNHHSIFKFNLFTIDHVQFTIVLNLIISGIFTGKSFIVNTIVLFVSLMVIEDEIIELHIVVQSKLASLKFKLHD
ncbi:MAG: hypothetical protein Q8S84_07795 [bacterium]|nr:hypothetical protein [bacterium]